MVRLFRNDIRRPNWYQCVLKEQERKSDKEGKGTWQRARVCEEGKGHLHTREFKRDTKAGTKHSRTLEWVLQ